MKAKNIIYALGAIVVLLVLWLFINEQEKSKRKDAVIAKLIQENNQLKSAYLALLEKYLLSTNSAEPSIIKELNKLKSEIDQLDTATHQELNSVIRLVNDNEGPKAVKDLAKIVEVHLKGKVKDDISFTKKPMLNNLLEHARNCNWISEQMFEFAKILKEIRNKESHELAVQIPSHIIGLAIFSGIAIIYKLQQVHA